jgi:hypothetical protein
MFASNKIELSMMETELEKIRSQYHLRSSYMAPASEPLFRPQQSTMSFGTAQGERRLEYEDLEVDQTLNKQGQPVPPPNQKGLPLVNPKELSNEELEYIIQTGQLPPRFQSVDMQKTSQQHPSLMSYMSTGSDQKPEHNKTISIQ